MGRVDRRAKIIFKMILEPKVKIGSKAKENLERVKGLVRLAIGNSSLEDFTHIYQDMEKRITVESMEKAVKVSIFYKKGLVEREIYSIEYSKLV